MMNYMIYTTTCNNYFLIVVPRFKIHHEILNHIVIIVTYQGHCIYCNGIVICTYMLSVNATGLRNFGPGITAQKRRLRNYLFRKTDN
jgi:hypothetical protein